MFVYLKTSMDKLKSRIEARGREYEDTLDEDELYAINCLYDKFFEYTIKDICKSKVLVIETDKYDPGQVLDIVLTYLNSKNGESEIATDK